MSFDQCMANAVESGEISQNEADELKTRYERARNAHNEGSPISSPEKALRDLQADLKAENAHKRRKAKLAIKNLNRVHYDLLNHKNVNGKADIGDAALALLEHNGSAQFSSVAGRQDAIVGRAHGKMEAVLHHFRRDAIMGDKKRHNAPDMGKVVAEAFGEDGGDPAAKALFHAWRDTAEWLRQRFNAAGGAIPKLENWGLPQHHDALALRKAGLQTWREKIKPMLDISKMKHPLSGRPVREYELDDVLTDVWRSVVTDGWYKRDPSRAPAGSGALANQNAEHRFLVFRKTDDWLTYQDEFGGGDPFSAMMGYVNLMSRDIAAMEILGPNPTGTINYVKQMVQKEGELASIGKSERMAGRTDRAPDYGRKIEKRVDDVWASIRGELETPVNSKAANTLAGVRNWITASVLGSAQLSSLSDIGTSAIAREITGLGATGTVQDMVKALAPSTKREAVEAGLILDAAQNVFHKQARYVGTLNGPEWSQWLADRVLTVSGLTPWTQAGRHAFGLAFQVEAAKHVKKPLAQLPQAFRETFARYGIDARLWDEVRRAKLHKGKSGVAMLRPEEIAAGMDEVAAERYLEMILQETEYAIPSGTHRSRTLLINSDQPGTFWGEVKRSFGQFKSFGAVYAVLHGRRLQQISQTKGKQAAGYYAGGLLLSTYLFGSLALQLKQIASGRDPRDMTTMDFTAAAVMQGGGLGIYGDFLFAELNRYGGGVATTLGGPVVAKGNQALNLTIGNVVQLASGEKTHFGREAVNFMRGMTPGSNIWYLRTAFERNVMDQIQFLVDPEANKVFKRRQQFWKREYGQDFYWKPGKRAPDRGADLSTIAGG